MPRDAPKCPLMDKILLKPHPFCVPLTWSLPEELGGWASIVYSREEGLKVSYICTISTNGQGKGGLCPSEFTGLYRQSSC